MSRTIELDVEHDCDLHVPVRPGTDLPLALALARCWNEWGAIDRAFLADHADDPEPLLAAVSGLSATGYLLTRYADEAATLTVPTTAMPAAAERLTRPSRGRRSGLPSVKNTKKESRSLRR